MIKKILIANRGEVVVRIASTAKKMGINTVAIFSDADENAYHTKVCDEKVYIGKSSSIDSYLNIKNIIKNAKQLNVDAIHPGYGFLSENADFAQSCINENIIFIGPSPKSIRLMAVKTKALNKVKKLGVPILPGFDTSNLHIDEIKRRCEVIKYPVMIKAAYGGGGRGMRAVYNKDNLEVELNSAARESFSAFGNKTLLIEKLIDFPRHIEVQIISDKNGKTLHLYDRDCSIQRNNQKIVEECPSLNIDCSVKSKMYQASIKIAKSINYIGLGTLEFLLDRDGSFYFMEMNTRLQVEHGVTEKVTGLDLLELQINVASGKPLVLNQENINLNGHSVEVRLYAEDPEENYKPCSGKILNLYLPKINNIRYDMGYKSLDTISPYYDAMIGKVISHDRSRLNAIENLKNALLNLRIYGITNNKYLLYNILDNKNFLKGNLNTKFIQKNKNTMNSFKKDFSYSYKFQVANSYLKNRIYNLKTSMLVNQDKYSPWDLVNGFRLNATNIEKLRFREDNNEFSIYIEYLDNHIMLKDDENNKQIYNSDIKNDTYFYNNKMFFEYQGLNRTISIINNLDKGVQSEVADKQGLYAPMPGKIVKIFYKKNDQVKKNSLLLIIEAMKMEHKVICHTNGIVNKVNFKEGDLVNEGSILIELR